MSNLVSIFVEGNLQWEVKIPCHSRLHSFVDSLWKQSRVTGHGHCHRIRNANPSCCCWSFGGQFIDCQHNFLSTQKRPTNHTHPQKYLSYIVYQSIDRLKTMEPIADHTAQGTTTIMEKKEPFLLDRLGGPRTYGTGRGDKIRTLCSLHLSLSHTHTRLLFICYGT